MIIQLRSRHRKSIWRFWKRHSNRRLPSKGDIRNTHKRERASSICALHPRLSRPGGVVRDTIEYRNRRIIINYEGAKGRTKGPLRDRNARWAAQEHTRGPFHRALIRTADKRERDMIVRNYYVHYNDHRRRRWRRRFNRGCAISRTALYYIASLVPFYRMGVWRLPICDC